ncbi:carbohydrate kinase [Acholeplasma equirhinis]|uniref:carbohydrate kinase family protein n=1 Tax=Acholeplasma equirhinis TaxID=555393 RepID=UPI00197AC2A1|nr:carbohydrate kinase [Acholeplasma equirhinis]MBN3490923.1 carbohydrate kinase [Acholeplasma equirhinis]
MIYSVGEILFDYIETKPNQYLKNPGGAPANVAVLIKRLKGASSFIGSISLDSDGNELFKLLKEEDIDLSFVKRVSNPSMKAYVHLNQGERTFTFDRMDTADLNLSLESIKDIKFKEDILHFCSLSLANEKNRLFHKTLIEAMKRSQGIVSFDVNLRLNLVYDLKEHKEIINEFLSHSDIVKLTDEEITILFSKEEKKAVLELLNQGVKIVLVSKGPNGATLYTKASELHIDAKKVEVIDTTGAGDAFIGAFLYKIDLLKIRKEDLDSYDFNEILKYSVDIATKTVTKLGAISSYIFD